MRIAIMLAILAFVVLPSAKAAPFNNEATEIVNPQVSTTLTVEVKPDVAEQKATESPTERTVTWKDNPNNCNTDTQFILKDTFECKDKPKSKKSTPIVGSKEEWLRQAGIPESEWGYVDYIVSHESSWNPNAVNESSGACSLVQALPCSKLGTNWNDPVHALKWQHAYVTDRYGGYAQAYSFWVRNNWY